MGKVKEDAMQQIEDIAIKTGKDPKSSVTDWNPSMNFYDYLSTLTMKEKNAKK